MYMWNEIFTKDNMKPVLLSSLYCSFTVKLVKSCLNLEKVLNPPHVLTPAAIKPKSKNLNCCD